jgi:hypothetical protein
VCTNDAEREKKNRNIAFAGVGFAVVGAGIFSMILSSTAFVGLLATGVVLLGFGLAKVFKSLPNAS